ncbi:hypothetical protein [Acidobacterium sp. S8]|uniref:hypothetical protein n=1 Tax=Acidobacterium sp. S8 TaxID=1641854 RepID=UPI00131C6EA3|nr:hypothetical protein [Acidobacterium sp. S8]
MRTPDRDNFRSARAASLDQENYIGRQAADLGLERMLAMISLLASELPLGVRADEAMPFGELLRVDDHWTTT